MITNLDVSNFRGFAGVQLHDLRRVNLIVGKNGSGKTALLEAIFIGTAGHPFVANIADTGRGLPWSIGVKLESISKYLFNNENESIGISYSDTEIGAVDLKIQYEPDGTLQLPVGDQREANTSIVPSSTLGRLHFRAKRSLDGRETDFQVWQDPNGQIQMSPGPQIGPGTTFYMSVTGVPEQNAIQFLSGIIQKGERDEVVSLLRKVFPSVKGIEILSLGFPRIYVFLEGHPRPLPFSVVSAGMFKVLSIVLEILQSPNRILLIDEIENGIYYGAFPQVWRLLFELARSKGKQLFISTHSKECIDAAVLILDEDPENLSLIRTYTREEAQDVDRSGSQEASVVLGKKAIDLIKAGFEVRI